MTTPSAVASRRAWVQLVTIILFVLIVLGIFAVQVVGISFVWRELVTRLFQGPAIDTRQGIALALAFDSAVMTIAGIRQAK